MSEISQFEVKNAKGEKQSLSAYDGKVLLIVNVASECGFTNQYEGLQKLHEQFYAKGLQVLGFPCNQFGGQESGTDEAIQSFCTGSFGVQFPVFAKIEVNGAHADPLFVHLKKSAPGILGTEMIKWNFTKFLVSSTGKVLKRYAPNDKPESMISDIEAALLA